MRDKFIMVLALVVFSACSSKDTTAGTRVGGPCSYESFEGSCAVTGRSGEGSVIFDFEGSVDGRSVRLTDNKSSVKPEIGAEVPCKLQFIKKGTCTPCLFSIGECGKEAWSIFRNRKGN